MLRRSDPPTKGPVVKKVKFLAALPVAAAAIVVAATAASAATSLSVSPSTSLKDGQTVTVTGSGYLPSTTIYVLQCSANPGSQAACDTAHLATAQSDASGNISTKLAVHTGAIGNGTCKAGGTCWIDASDAGAKTSGVSAITFASASSSTGSSGSTGSTGSSGSTGSTGSSGSSGSSGSTGSTGTSSTPTAVNAGSGGGADRN